MSVPSGPGWSHVLYAWPCEGSKAQTRSILPRHQDAGAVRSGGGDADGCQTLSEGLGQITGLDNLG